MSLAIFNTPPSRAEIQRVIDDIACAMKQDRIDPAIIYAFRKTERLVQHNAAQQAEWDAAIAEYKAQEGGA